MKSDEMRKLYDRVLLSNFASAADSDLTSFSVSFKPAPCILLSSTFHTPSGYNAKASQKYNFFPNKINKVRKAVAL